MLRKSLILAVVLVAGFGIARLISNRGKEVLVETETKPPLETVVTEPEPPTPRQPFAPPKRPSYTTRPQQEPPKKEALSPEQMVEKLKKQLDADPKNPQLLAALGLVLARDLQKPEEGIPYLEQSVKLDPANGSAQYDLVGAYLASGRADRGDAFLAEATAKPHSDPMIAATQFAARADLQASTGNLDGALQNAERAADLDRSPQNQALLASVMLQKGDPGARDVAAEAVRGETERLQAAKERNQPTEPIERSLNEMKKLEVEGSIQAKDFGTAAEQNAGLMDDEDKQRNAEIIDKQAPN